MTAVAAGREPTVALVGRPNAGKTSLLMHLTGTAQRPVNFPGTSVERVESPLQVGDRTLRLVDLPGVSSLQAISRDEAVTLDYLRGAAGAPPDVLCAVLDAGRLSIELRLLQQLRGFGVPIVVALTKVDVAAAEGMPVDVAALQRALGLPLVVVNAFTGTNIAALRAALGEAVAAAGGAAPAAAAAPPDGGAADALAARVQAPRPRHRSRTDRLDGVLLHPLLGPLLLLVVFGSVFQLVFTVAAPCQALVAAGQGLVAGGLEAVLPEGALRSFLVDGLVNGLGSVLTFVPQIALLIAAVTLLESSGYMARAVFLLDRVLRKVGLTGKSFVPLTSSFACAIPGILASRIITDERDRLATVVVAPLMSCSARLPVYVVLIGAFFAPATAGLVLLLLYVLGVATAFAVAFVLRRTLLRGGRSLLAMELPVYQRPSVRVLGTQVWLSVREFLRSAGTVILAVTIAVWFGSYYPRPPAVHAHFAGLRAAVPAGADGDAARARLEAEEARTYLEQSWLAGLGKAVQPAFAPAGFDWRTTVGILAAFPARELIVPTLGTLHSLGPIEARDAAGGQELAPALRAAMDRRTAFALMTFFALCSQCAATLSAIRRETHSWRWPLFTFAYMTALAWVAAVVVQQCGAWVGL